MPAIARAEDAGAPVDTEAARIHFQAGEQYYVRGHYDQAIREFEEAYRLSGAAALLYNISQAYERIDNLPRARDYLQRYLDSGTADPDEVPALRDKVQALDQRIEARARPIAPPPSGPAPPARPPEGRRPLRPWKWIAAGAGVALAGAASWLAMDAASAEQELEDAAGMGRTYDEELASTYERGQRDVSLAWATGVAGGVFLAAGAVLFVVDAKDERGPAAATLKIAPEVGAAFTGARALWRF